MDQERIKEIGARCEAATPGPWTASECEWECDCGKADYEKCTGEDPATCGKGRVITGAFVPQTKTVEYGDYCDMDDSDAEFIAHARQDVPDMLDYIAELEQKQIPRLPAGTPIDSSTDFNLNCPCCGYKFVSNIGGEYVTAVYAKHCPNCGQAIRWS